MWFLYTALAFSEVHTPKVLQPYHKAWSHNIAKTFTQDNDCRCKLFRNSGLRWLLFRLQTSRPECLHTEKKTFFFWSSVHIPWKMAIPIKKSMNPAASLVQRVLLSLINAGSLLLKKWRLSKESLLILVQLLWQEVYSWYQTCCLPSSLCSHLLLRMKVLCYSYLLPWES